VNVSAKLHFAKPFLLIFQGFQSPFPNPANKEVWISMESVEKAKISLTLSDMTGRLMQTVEIPVIQGHNILPLHKLVHLSPGMYFLKITTNHSETTRKLVLKK